jgi:hypothetical protein
MILSRLKGDRTAMFEYVTWAWIEEKRKDEWRKANGKPGRVLSWQLLFGPASPIFAEWQVVRSRRRR